MLMKNSQSTLFCSHQLNRANISFISPSQCAKRLCLTQLRSLIETIYLESLGIGQIVRTRELDNSGFTRIDVPATLISGKNSTRFPAEFISTGDLLV